jgi:hypothetical protein
MNRKLYRKGMIVWRLNVYSTPQILHLLRICIVCFINMYRLKVTAARQAKASGYMAAMSCGAAFAVPSSRTSSRQLRNALNR